MSLGIEEKQPCHCHMVHEMTQNSMVTPTGASGMHEILLSMRVCFTYLPSLLYGYYGAHFSVFVLVSVFVC